MTSSQTALNPFLTAICNLTTVYISAASVKGLVSVPQGCGKDIEWECQSHRNKPPDCILVKPPKSMFPSILTVGRFTGKWAGWVSAPVFYG